MYIKPKAGKAGIPFEPALKSYLKSETKLHISLFPRMKSKYAMRYYEIFEEPNPAEKMKRDAAKRCAANAKRDAAQRRKNTAAHRYQDSMRSSNDAIQSANNALANIKPS